jgi:hypothetical protein
MKLGDTHHDTKQILLKVLMPLNYHEQIKFQKQKLSRSSGSCLIVVGHLSSSPKGKLVLHCLYFHGNKNERNHNNIKLTKDNKIHEQVVTAKLESNTHKMIDRQGWI